MTGPPNEPKYSDQHAKSYSDGLGSTENAGHKRTIRHPLPILPAKYVDIEGTLQKFLPISSFSQSLSAQPFPKLVMNFF